MIFGPEQFYSPKDSECCLDVERVYGIARSLGISGFLGKRHCRKEAKKSCSKVNFDKNSVRIETGMFRIVDYKLTLRKYIGTSYMFHRNEGNAGR